MDAEGTEDRPSSTGPAGRLWALAARTLRSRSFRIAVVSFLFAYVSSYFILSRSGSAIARVYNAEGFLYVPCPWEAYEDIPALETLHYVLVCFYYPIWLVDHHVFGGSAWGNIPMWGISASTHCPWLFAPSLANGAHHLQHPEGSQEGHGRRASRAVPAVRHEAPSARANQPRVRRHNLTSMSITGTSIRTPTTVASAAPEEMPKSIVAVAIATSK